MKFTELKSQIRSIIKEELRNNKKRLNENQVTSIPKFNTESDFYIAMLSVLKGDGMFESIVEEFGLKVFNNPSDFKNDFITFKSKLSKVVKGRLIDKTCQHILNTTKDRRMIEIASNIRSNPANPKVIQLLNTVLANGVIFDLREDPIGFSKRMRSPKLLSAAGEFSATRGKMKMMTMMGNKGF